MSASFFAAQSAIETAFAALESGEAPRTAAIHEALTGAIQKIEAAGALEPSESRWIATAALQLAENLREFIAALKLPSGLINRCRKNIGVGWKVCQNGSDHSALSLLRSLPRR